MYREIRFVQEGKGTLEARMRRLEAQEQEDNFWLQ